MKENKVSGEDFSRSYKIFGLADLKLVINGSLAAMAWLAVFVECSQ